MLSILVWSFSMLKFAKGNVISFVGIGHIHFFDMRKRKSYCPTKVVINPDGNMNV